MRLVLRQTPRTIDRLFGSGGARGKVEFCGYNEEGQLLYTIIIDLFKFTIYDAVGNIIVTMKKEVWSIPKRCYISGVNGIQGVFQRNATFGKEEYVWSYGNYRICGQAMGLHYDVFQNGYNVMHIMKQLQDFREHYWIDISNPGYMLDGVIIAMAIALLDMN